MRLMDELHEMDQLERQLQRARDPNDLDQIDREQVEQLLGEEAKQDLEQLRRSPRCSRRPATSSARATAWS